MLREKNEEKKKEKKLVRNRILNLRLLRMISRHAAHSLRCRRKFTVNTVCELVHKSLSETPQRATKICVVVCDWSLDKAIVYRQNRSRVPVRSGLISLLLQI